MRVVAAVMVLGACSPNDQVPARPDAQHADAASTADAPRADARLDAGPDAWIAPPDVPVNTNTGIYPLEPTYAAVGFEWQSLQDYFRRSDGSTCSGQVTVSVSDHAVCFVGVDDDVHCAGSIYTHDYGHSFTPIGQTGVDQIWLGATFNSVTGNAICIHKRAGSVWCMGDANENGQFGNGTKTATATFTQFGNATNLVHMGGDADTRCAIDTAGKVFCAGYDTSSTLPVAQPGSGHHAFYVTAFGTIVVDGPDVYRQSNDSRCEIHGDGMHCNDPTVPMLSGTAGQVVDGGIVAPIGGLAVGDPYPCWLDPMGKAWCTQAGTTAQIFTSAPPLVALATNFYADARCAVANDGSLWCSGSNVHGELGTGTTSPLPVDTMVVAPGNVKVDCH